MYRYIRHFATDPMDGTYSMRRGGRWNPPGSFPVVYTSCTVDVAIANLWHQHEGEVAPPWAVSEDRQPDLYEIHIDQEGLVDIVSADGIAGVGLSAGYPRGAPRAATQPVGQRLHAERRPGIWCKSAALPSAEEVALFTDFSNHPTTVAPPKRLWDWFPVPKDWRPS